jgi:hypothetical protein
LVLVLVGVQDVGPVRVQEVGDGGDQPLTVGAVDQQDGGIFVFPDFRTSTQFSR